MTSSFGLSLLSLSLVLLGSVVNVSGQTTYELNSIGDVEGDFTGYLTVKYVPSSTYEYKYYLLNNSAFYDGIRNSGGILLSENDKEHLNIYITFLRDYEISKITLNWDQSTALSPLAGNISYIDANTLELKYVNDSYFETFAGSGFGRFQWDGEEHDAVIYATNEMEIQIPIFGLGSNTYLSEIDIQGRVLTSAPSTIPSSPPTTGSPTPPSPSPTKSPTVMPTDEPTTGPTPAPTYTQYLHITERDEDSNDTRSNFTQSTNVYALSLRNETYNSFTVPGGGAYCTTCLLAWADIDARISVPGCEDSLDFGVTQLDGSIYSTITPGDFYYCNGTWVLETSGSLIDWQQTYSRIEIWEVDDYGRKYQQLYYEFQWNNTKCKWYNENTGEEEDCDVLPLTGTTTYAALFKWTMPKGVTDNRDQPLIVVWYDLLSVPYALRPNLNDSFDNLTFSFIQEGVDLSLDEVVAQFEVALYAVGALLIGFIIVMIIACIAADEAILKADYMLDTRDLRSTYIHSVTTLIAPQSELRSRSKFSMKRHGLWLFLVLAFRLVYMAIFTFWFFILVFTALNNASFNVLDKYDGFAHERDTQLTNMSADIESYYYNETDRMEAEVESRQYYCYAVYINETANLYVEGALAQYNNHSTQMQNSLDGIDFNVSTGMYIEGNTACDITSSSGSGVGGKDPYISVVYNDDDSYNSTIRYRAETYDRFNPNKTEEFAELEDFLTSICETLTWCVGWTWIDAYCNNDTSSYNSTTNITTIIEGECYNNSYYFLETMGDPINSELSGICYTESDFDASLFNFDTIDQLANYTDYLENLYLADYQADVDSLYDMFSSIWDSFKALTGDENDNKYEVEIDTSATEFDVTVYKNYIRIVNGQEDTNFTTSWTVLISCPGCPDGNFSSAYLQQLSDYLFAYNYSNISDFVNTVGGNAVNFSDVVSVNTALLDYPDIPEIDLPFDFSLPNLGFWDFIATLYISLDVLLFIYRWYRTAGILATIVRGKDVEIQLKYLQTEVAEPRPCWDGREFGDKLLNSIIWCHDQIRHCGYNLWKFMYWISSILCLSIVVILILMAYVIVDAVVTEEFFESLGAFDLLTVGIAAQRSIRNEVICTTALAYNNYTLELLQDSRETYASEKNSDAWDQNLDELERVNEYNSYFCTAYTAYQATTRDVLRDTTDNYDILDYHLSGVDDITTVISDAVTKVSNIFDQDDSTSFGISSTDASGIPNSDTYLSITIELPYIDMTAERNCYWQLSEMEFDWTFDSNGTKASTISEITFTVESRDTNATTDSWVEQELERGYFSPTDTATTYINTIEENNLEWDDDVVTRYLRFNFSSIEEWQNTYYLNEITLYGYADEDCIGCQTVSFYYWDFDATDTYIELCPEVTPVHGIMYSGFVRDWLTEQLIDGHGPFIRSIRNIALSPFAILFVGSISLVFVYLVAFVVEWVLLKVNLYRENPYAKVSLVHAKNSEFYDPSMHDVDAKSGSDPHNDKTTYFGNSGTLLGQDGNATNGSQPNVNGGGGGGSGSTGNFSTISHGDNDGDPNYHGNGSNGNVKRASEIENNMHTELTTMRNTLRKKATAPAAQRKQDQQNASSYLASIGVTAAQNQQNIVRQKSDTQSTSSNRWRE